MRNAPTLTVLCSVNTGGHMVPASMFISANVKEATMFRFIEGTHQKVVEHARAITLDPAIVQDRTPDLHQNICAAAALIVLHGFLVLHWMIDKCRANLNALLKYIRKHQLFGRVYIRLCQFHVIQAILRWDWEIGKRGLGFPLSLDIKFEILYHFRELQRCRSLDNWEAAKCDEQDIHHVDENTLSQMLEDRAKQPKSPRTPRKPSDDGSEEISDDDDDDEDASGEEEEETSRRKLKSREVLEAQYTAVCAYFEANCFIEPWIETFTDIGMPANQTRDGAWNTNNWAETAFKTFDSVFLDNRMNKRIDRLAVIILNDFLRFFRYWSPCDRPLNQRIIALHTNAHNLWEQDRVVQVAEDTFDVEVVNEAGSVVRFRVTMNPINCVCTGFKQTGKYCLHLLAVRLLLSNGKAEDWKEREFSGATKLVKTGKKKKSRTDASVQDEFEKILKKIAAADAKTVTASLAKDDHLFDRPHGDGIRNRPGRPGDWYPRLIGHISRRNVGIQNRRGCMSAALPINSQALARVLEACSGEARRKQARREAAAALLAAALAAAKNEGETALDNPELSVEDLDIHSTSHEEMQLFAACLNAMEVAIKKGLLFVIGAPHAVTQAVMDAFNWTVPITTAKRPVVPVWRNPLPNPTPHLSSEQINTNAPWPAVEKELFLSDYLWSGGPLRQDNLPVPDAVHKKYWEGFSASYNYVGLQKDSTSCGFWAVLIAFMILLDINGDHADIRSLNISDLQETLGTIYYSFIANPIGVPSSLLWNVFAKFHPGVNPDEYDAEYIAKRPQSIAQVTLPPELTQAAPFHAPLPQFEFATLYDPRFGDLAKVHWTCGEYLPTATQFLNLAQGGQVEDEIVDIYLSLAKPAGQWTELAPTRFGLDLFGAAKNAINGIPPSKKGGERYWLPARDMFELNYLVIPWHWGNNGDSSIWMAAIIDFKASNISIYDPETGGGAVIRRRKAAYSCVRQMLSYEYVSRKHGDLLPAKWAQEPTINLAKADRVTVGQLIAAEIHRDQREPNTSHLRKLSLLKVPGSETSAATPPETPTAETEDILDWAEEATEKERCYSEFKMIKTLFPLLPSTKRLVFLEPELTIADLRLLHSPEVADLNNVYFPAIVQSHDTLEVVLEWFRDVLPPQPLQPPFRLPYSEWENAVSARTLDTAQVTFNTRSKNGQLMTAIQIAPILWPALLTDTPHIFPSPLYPIEDALSQHLHERMPDILSSLLALGDEKTPPTFITIREPSLASSYSSMFYEHEIGAPRGAEPFSPSDEMALTFTAEVLEQRQRMHESHVYAEGREIDGSLIRSLALYAGRLMLAVVTAAFYLEIKIEEAYQLLRARKVRRPRILCEEVWQLYGRSIRDATEAGWRTLCNTHRVIVPGITLPSPRRMSL
ncbi:hypothetical protein B0H17DRAFT_1131242 [Mycena rosella]|uniref:SWIM-type domain-containing protein n=1 Tax=Mycena rosella TaxID=1033263 RepID=A0AAD7DPJ3_MYCRO|nr:hypothetical protein B0H17DRAFT_1131242 [Mycena rosella]